MQFDVKRGGRKCSLTEQPFQPGEIFFSALIETDTGAQRKDYSKVAWEDAELADSDDTIGWWKQRVPELDNGKVYWAPDAVLLAYFDSLQTPEHSETAWVMALLLIQKRLLARERDHGSDESVHIFNCKRNGQSYELREPDIDPEKIADIQNHLAANLFSDRPLADES